MASDRLDETLATAKPPRNPYSHAISRLCTAGRKEITPELLAFYTEAWEGDALDPERVDAATRRWVREQKFMASPAEICELVVSMMVEEAARERGPEPEPHWRRSSFRCRECEDTGFVTVWHPAALKAALEFVAGRLDRPGLRRQALKAAARCSCDIGQARGGSARIFDGRMVRVERGDGELGVGTLIEWGRAWRPGNYVPEFGNYGDGEAGEGEWAA